jgi:hypothetical protein
VARYCYSFYVSVQLRWKFAKDCDRDKIHAHLWGPFTCWTDHDVTETWIWSAWWRLQRQDSRSRILFVIFISHSHPVMCTLRILTGLVLFWVSLKSAEGRHSERYENNFCLRITAFCRAGRLTFRAPCKNCIWGSLSHKGKAVPLHAMEALGERRGIAPTHSQPRH